MYNNVQKILFPESMRRAVLTRHLILFLEIGLIEDLKGSLKIIGLNQEDPLISKGIQLFHLHLPI